MQQQRDGSGFTLIEIMVVVSILSLLATVVAPRIVRRSEATRHTTALADIKGIDEALHRFKRDNGFYPSMADGLQALARCPRTARHCPLDGYLETAPIDPWGTPYVYFSDGQQILVKSYGGDGREGGDGTNADLDNRES